MKLNRVICLLLYIAISIYAAAEQKILVLNSYNRGYEWTENLTKGIKDNLGGAFDVTMEYMDAKRSNEEAYFEYLKNLYKIKYKSEKFNLIIATDEEALKFLFKNKDEIFGDIYVVSCGNNYFAKQEIEKRARYTAVMQNFDVAKNIDLAIRLNNNLKNIYFVTDKTTSGKENLKRVIELVNYYPRINFKIVDSVSFIELKVLISNIRDSESAIIFFGYFMDSEGKINSVDESLGIIKENAKVPVYSFWYSYVGRGILGGMVVSGEQQGKMAAELAKEVLYKGKSAEKVSIIKDKEEIYVFDEDYLKKFNIQRNILPRRSVIFSNFDRNYARYKDIILITIGIIGFSFTIIILLIINIYRRKAVENELNEKIAKQELLLKVIEQSPITVEISDRQQYIEYVNPAYYEVTGFKRKDIIGKKIIIPEEAVSELKNKESWTGEVEYTKKNGENYYELTSIIPVYGRENKLINYIKVGKDITNKVIEEEALKQAKQKAEELNELKDRFIANMSHEVRTPLNGIIGLSEIAAMTAKTPEEKERAEKILGLSESLLLIVNDILDFSKIENKKLKINYTIFNFREMVKNTVEIFKGDIRKKGLDFYYFVSNEVPETVCGDSLRFQQVIINLCGNAIKFTEKGSVMLTVENISRNAGECIIRVAVEDTGIGIPDEKHDAVFNAFTQIDDSDTKRYGGAGLGLAICKSLVENMNGRIDFTSRLGEGTTFYAEVPFEAGEPYNKKIFDGYEAVIIEDRKKAIDCYSRIFMEAKIPYLFCDTTEEAGEMLKESGFYEVNSKNIKLLVPEYYDEFIAKTKDDCGLENVIVVCRRDETENLQNKKYPHMIFEPINQDELLSRLSPKDGNENQNDVSVKKTESIKKDSGKGMKILLIEDNEINIEIITHYLKLGGFEVVCYKNGREALENLSENYYDAALIDIQLPDMDGFEITRAIRDMEKDGRKKMPVIAITAHAVKGYIEKAVSSGMDDYITKPFKINGLYNILSKNIPGFTKNNVEINEKYEENMEMYGALLKIFNEKHAGTADKIREALDKDDYITAEHEIHDLKNSFGVLKKNRCHKICEQLEEMAVEKKEKTKMLALIKEIEEEIKETANEP